MQFDQMIQIVEPNIEKITRTWQSEVIKSDYMNTYKTLPEEELLKRGAAVFINLIKWLKSGAQNKEVELYFEKVGAERTKEGFPLTEVNYALYLTKKVFWSFVLWKKEVIDNLNSSEAVELMTILNNYFDLGIFFIIRGYLHELFTHLDETKKFTKAELQNYLLKGALFKESAKEIKEKLYGNGSAKGVIR